MVEKTERAPQGDELENLPLFRGLDFESIRGLLEACPTRELEKGDVLLEAGQPNQLLYLLLTGHLQVHLRLGTEPIALLGPGEVVGELSLIHHALTTAYVVADEDCRLLVLDEQTMWSLVDASPIARNLLFLLAGRLRHGDEVILSSQELQRQYQEYAVTDGLTGLYNRRWLDKTLLRQMKRFTQVAHDFSILLIDIDAFKQYNDRYGHVAGDRVLYGIAQTIQEGMRPGEIIARYGGDEFIVLLPNTDAREARKIADRLRRSVGKARISHGEKDPSVDFSISVGIAQLSGGDVPETLIAAADTALYRAKSKGGNRVASAGQERG